MRFTLRWKPLLMFVCVIATKSTSNVTPVCWLCTFCSVPVEWMRSVRLIRRTAAAPVGCPASTQLA